MYKFEATQRFGPVGQACVEHQHYVALSLSCGTHILLAIECTQKISHWIFHPQKNHHGILHPQENHHGILSSKAFLTMEYVIHEAVDALAWGSKFPVVDQQDPRPSTRLRRRVTVESNLNAQACLGRGQRSSVSASGRSTGASRSRSRSMAPRVHKNKSMQHHTLGSGTAEFQVTWPPKLREGTYLVKNVRAPFEYRKTIAAHEKQVIRQEKAQPCASLWRKTLRPKRVRFLAIDAPIVDYVCHLTFLGSYQLLCEFSWRKKKEKAR